MKKKITSSENYLKEIELRIKIKTLYQKRLQIYLKKIQYQIKVIRGQKNK